MNEAIINQPTAIAQGFMANQQQTMSSREIAELTGKRHDHVMVDIQKMMDGLSLSAPDFTGTYSTDQGNTYKCFFLPKRETLILISGYRIEIRAKIIDRWQELESRSAVSLPDFTNPAAAARAWADEVEAKQTAMLHLEQARPAVTFVDKYVDSTGLKSFREVCKVLQANESRFREFLADRKIMYRLGGAWTAYQCHIDAGRLSVKTGVSERNGHVFTEVKFTPKGVNWVAGEWGKHQIQGEVA
ncbi:phage antirepressor KilAC domain-containing protein [Allopusillimonas ginsengisoli]|uniref:phage antirepressor KilAC domain-containing protein n=1 Tax=Allopusillimonas ginsengisoli TaxID=453575 RepID=UPI0039C3E646